jgi:tetratricopeptide (TPR) repeat protein
MGDHLTSLGKTEEASEYYQKFLEAAVPIYQQTGEASVLWNAITTYDKLGDNKYTLGLYDEAHSYRLKALELFEQYVKMDPDVQKYDSYFRDKVKQGETE